MAKYFHYVVWISYPQEVDFSDKSKTEEIYPDDDNDKVPNFWEECQGFKSKDAARYAIGTIIPATDKLIWSMEIAFASHDDYGEWGLIL